MKTSYRILSLIVVLGMLLSAVTPAFAQDSWPSTPGAAGSAAPSTSAPSAARKVAPEAVPADAVAADGVSPRAVSPNVNLVGQSQRDRSVRPGVPLHAASAGLSPEVAALSRSGDALVRTVIQLDKPALAQVADSLTPDQRVAYAAEVAALQDKVVAEVEALGGQVVFRFSTLSSGFAAMIPSNQVPRVAGLPNVARVRGINDYELDLSETVPWVGGTALQSLGITGQGVNVAVIDSGIDFTHQAFGGPGTVAGWEESYYGADPDCINEPWLDTCAANLPANPALFGPNAPKVKGGYDWLGELWPLAQVILPDPNPIDYEGHGTHVADIIAGFGYAAGTNADGAYAAKGAGMAPGANIWGFKACASFSTSCNGLALLASVDDAADLDNNPATKDPADIINMSLGSSYGQPEDDLTFFTNQAAAYGIIMVVSAGNSADKPFIVGSPSMADGAISVAQTTVPSAKQFLLGLDGAITGTLESSVFQPWSVPLATTGALSGTIVYGNSDGSNLNGCVAYTDDMTGKVVLSDRGGCNFTLKAKNAADAGAVLSLIGLVAPGDPFEGGDGGDVVTIPSFMISQSESNAIKAAIANDDVLLVVDPTNFIGLSDSIVGSSSRGPRNNDNAIKPDIGAPGASISAIAGSGSVTGPFGGTSGAAPMVSGAAALLKGFFKNQLTPQQYKALLMNSANPAIYMDGSVDNGGGGNLAPVTRIGGGQVEVDEAYRTRILAWDSTNKANPLSWTGSLSFGYVPVTESYVATRTLSIKNLGALGQSVTIESFFRYGEDFRMGLFVTPGEEAIFIPAGGTVEVPVVLEIFGGGNADLGLAPLHPWVLNKGSLGASGAALSFQEYDGYVVIRAQNGDIISVPWQVLPKDAADVRLAMGRSMPGSSSLVNQSPVHTGVTEGFALVDVSPNDYGYTVGDCTSLGLPPGCNETAIDLKEVGVRDLATNSGQLLEFGITLWDEPYRSSQYPVEIDIYIDVNRDGTDDFVIFNADVTLNGADGRNVVFVRNLTTNVSTPYFFVDSDFNTQNFILTAPAAVLGLAPGQQFDFSVYAFDAYFTGSLWDCSPFDGADCGVHTYTLGQPRFNLGADELTIFTDPGSSVILDWASNTAGDVASPSQIGLLFMHRYAPIGRESDHLILAPAFVEAGGLTAEAIPPVAPVGSEISLAATVTTTEGLAVGNAVHFSDGSFTAVLTGTNEVPVPVTMTTASGVASFLVNFATGVTSYTLDVSDIVSPTMAHIHVGAAGSNGGVVHWLYDASGTNAPDSFPATGVITMTNSQILLMAEEGLYVNVHSSNYPAGEIRGQITGADTAFTESNGVATKVVTSTTPMSDMLYVLSGELMDTVAYTFTQSAAMSVGSNPAVIMPGRIVTVTATLTDTNGAPMANETVFATDGILKAELLGANEVPTNTSTATGMAMFVADPTSFDPISNTINVSYTLTATGLVDITGAHVHYGAPGVNGPVAYPLQMGAGSFKLRAADLIPLLGGQMYVNVHSTMYPGGEIRGQVIGAAMGVTGPNGRVNIAFTPNLVGLVTIYVAPVTNPVALLRNTFVNVMDPQNNVYISELRR